MSLQVLGKDGTNLAAYDANGAGYNRLVDSLGNDMSAATQMGKVVVPKIGTSPEQLAMEGQQLDLTVYSAGSNTVLAAGSVFANSLTFTICPVGSGRAAYVTDIVITTLGGAPFKANGYILPAGNSASLAPAWGENWNRTLGRDANNSQTIKVNRFFPEGSTFVYGFTATAPGYTPGYTVDVRGFSITDDMNFNAKMTIGVIGTSLEYNNMGNDAGGLPYKNKWAWVHQLKDALLLAGKSVRVVNKAVTSTTSADWLPVAQGNYVNGMGGVDYNMLIVSLMVNDCIVANGVSTAQAEANMKEWIYHRNRYSPKAAILFVAPPVTDTATRSGISAYRTSVNTVATDGTIGGTARNVFFYDASTAFPLNATATADTNFSSTERSAGNRIHPSGAGNTLIAAGALTVVQTMPWYSGTVYNS